MDPASDEDYGDEKLQYDQGGTITSLAEDELISEDDEFDDLYDDGNIGEGFLQMQQAQPPSGAGNGGLQASNANVIGHRAESMVSQGADNARSANQGNYISSGGVQYPEQKTDFIASGVTAQTLDASQRTRLPDSGHNSQSGHLGYQESIPMPPKFPDDGMNRSEKIVGEIVPARNPNVGASHGAPHIQANPMNSNQNVGVHRSSDDDYIVRPTVGTGNTMLFVGELHWWTTDAELESVLIQYGKVKEIKFIDERASGKSKGYCQVEFYDPAAAAACKDGMHGYIFNGRACVVTFATPHTIKQMGSSYGNKGFWPGVGPGRGRGGFGNKNMMGNTPGQAFGQGVAGPGFGGPPGLMHPQGMMAFMGRGAGYGGFSGPAFQGIIPPYPAVNSMGIPGVAPHMNPAFFSRGMTSNGMGMMANLGMEGPPSGTWNDPNMGAWGGEENSRGARESSYGGEDNTSEHGEANHDKDARSSAASREKERNSDRDRSGGETGRGRGGNMMGNTPGQAFGQAMAILGDFANHFFQLGEIAAQSEEAILTLKAEVKDTRKMFENLDKTHKKLVADSIEKENFIQSIIEENNNLKRKVAAFETSYDFGFIYAISEGSEDEQSQDQDEEEKQEDQHAFGFIYGDELLDEISEGSEDEQSQDQVEEEKQEDQRQEEESEEGEEKNEDDRLD